MSWYIRSGAVIATLLTLLAGAGCGSAMSQEGMSDYRLGDMFGESLTSDTTTESTVRQVTGTVARNRRQEISRSSLNEAEPPPSPMYAEAAPSQPESGSGGPSAPTTTPTPSGEQGQQGTQAVRDAGTSGPLLIYEAELNLAVHEVRERIDQVVEITDDVGGFLQSQDDTSVVIRVPATRFREALSRVEALGDVLGRRVSAQDVSDQVRDTRIRLRNAIQMRDRLAELLERAETVPDSLTIERELERLTQTIELLRGQLRSLEDRIAYSTITVRFEAVREDLQVPHERFSLPFPWLNELGLVHLLRL